jgi:hypothetical protein
MVSFTLRPLYPEGKRPWYSLNRRLGELQSRSGRGGEDRNSQPLPELEPPIIQLVAQRYTTELSRLMKHFMLQIVNMATVRVLAGSIWQIWCNGKL